MAKRNHPARKAEVGLQEPKPSQPRIDLERLPRSPMSELRRLWSTHMGRAAPPPQKQVLVRQLAWHIQEKEHGGLDAETQRLLNKAINAARRERFPAQSDSEQSPEVTQRSRRAKPGTKASTVLTPRELPANARLVRTWPAGTKNVHEVSVLPNGQGFLYRDHKYSNLTAIATAITGAKWSGPRFFGLTSRRAKPGLEVTQ